MSLLEERINESRLERGMSASELARAVGVTSAAVSRWEKGQVKNLRMEHLFTIARLLDINPEWLATGRGHKKGHLLNQQGSIHEPGPPTYEHLNHEEQILVDVYRRLSHSTRRNLKDFVLELAERLQQLQLFRIRHGPVMNSLSLHDHTFTGGFQSGYKTWLQQPLPTDAIIVVHQRRLYNWRIPCCIHHCFKQNLNQNLFRRALWNKSAPG